MRCAAFDPMRQPWLLQPIGLGLRVTALWGVIWRTALSCAVFSLAPIAAIAGEPVAMMPQASAARVIETAELTSHRADPVALVYPYLDTANSRWFYFSSAARPFGMVSLFPDTAIDGEWGSGYRYHEPSVKGFNHIHEWQLAGLSVMPLSDERPLQQIRGDYASAFSHAQEHIEPGYHQLRLQRFGIDVELTASSRVGMHRIQYPAGKPQQLLLQLGGVMGPSRLGHADVRQTGPDSLSGFITNQGTERRIKPVKVYFYLQFNQPIQKLAAWRDQMEFQQVQGISGDNAGLLVQLRGSAQATVLKVGLSYVSEKNAKLNLDTEVAHWDFDALRQAARDEWFGMLNRIQIQGGTQTQQRRFYTDLWHSLQGRRVISDVNGQYPDLSGAEVKTGQIPFDGLGKPLFNQHNSDSFWGAQWTIATLWPLVYPKVAADLGQSLLQYANDSGFIPRGPSGGQDTLVMTGAPTTPFLVSNIQKGVHEDLQHRMPDTKAAGPASPPAYLSIAAAYQQMVHNHSMAGVMAKAGYEHYSATGGGLAYYLKQGYIPYPLPADESTYGSHRRGAGQTLEYAYQDYALAQLAMKLGHQSDAATYLQRSQNYRQQFDTDSGYMRPRNLDGSWQTPFDPHEYENGFVEANPAQATWFVPHDIAGLAELMGGRARLIQRLDHAFQTAASQGFTAGTAHAQETHAEYRRTPINYGNQPSMQTAFIFSAAGAPWLTQFWSRRIVDTVYSDLSPDRGYNGDEDQGLMGSLAVLMKLGLFQLSGGVEADPIYQLGSPLFRDVRITLDPAFYPGKTFRIIAHNHGPDKPYIRQLIFNGQPLQRTYLRHSEIVQGGVLELQMSDQPNKALTE